MWDKKGTSGRKHSASFLVFLPYIFLSVSVPMFSARKIKEKATDHIKTMEFRSKQLKCFDFSVYFVYDDVIKTETDDILFENKSYFCIRLFRSRHEGLLVELFFQMTPDKLQLQAKNLEQTVTYTFMCYQ